MIKRILFTVVALASSVAAADETYDNDGTYDDDNDSTYTNDENCDPQQQVQQPVQQPTYYDNNAYNNNNNYNNNNYNYPVQAPAPQTNVVVTGQYGYAPRADGYWARDAYNNWVWVAAAPRVRYVRPVRVYAPVYHRPYYRHYSRPAFHVRGGVFIGGGGRVRW